MSQPQDSTLSYKYKYEKYSVALVKQLFREQDYALVGSATDAKGVGFDYLVVCDGHSSNTCIDAIRSFDFNQIMIKDKPMTELNDRLFATFKNFKNSGSTCVLAKIYEDHIYIEYVGDSQIVVFIDDAMVYLNEPHTLSNNAELERVKPLVLSISDEYAPKMISTKRLAMLKSDRCVFRHDARLIPTQALGHNGVTGFAPTSKRLDFMPGQHVRIIAGSDGFWDMMYLPDSGDMNDLKTMPPAELLLKAERRWKGEWIYSKDPNETDETKIISSNFDEMYDDIAIAFWDNAYLG